MPDKKILELQSELERTRSQIVEIETSMGGMVSSREVAQNLIKVTVEQMHEGVQIIDHEFRYVYLNEAAAKQGNQSRWDMLGKSMVDCFPQLKGTPFFETLTEVMHQRTSAKMENNFPCGDGSNSWYELFLEPHSIGVLIRSIDITARKRLEEVYNNSQKMESIGRLAGGIAHDFNNKLGVLTLYCEMAINKLDSSPDKVRGYLQKMQVAIQQSTTLTRQLLTFSRKQVLDLKVININNLLTAAQPNISKSGGDIKLDYILAPDLKNVRIDPAQFDQMVLHLCTNSRDAMPEGGTLTIETKNAELDEAYCQKHPDVKPGQFIVFSVSDTGTGMNDEVKSRAFEPFYTTKGERSTGLGLSMVHGIVKQCHGHIWISSELGTGTTFKIYFSVVDEPDKKALRA